MTDTKTFHETGVEAALADALAAKGITHPFPIQELTLPMALKGADIIGQARTGTGKTLGFGLPLLQRIDASQKRTQALVVVPTRELCIQVASDLEIGAERGVTSIAVYGGVPLDPQTDALTGGVHVVIGTPGRLLDHLNRGNLDLSHVTELVLDEADEMLDMGFLPDVERLIEATPSEGRHTMLFSATMPNTIVSLARRYMSHPTFMRAEMEESDVAPTVEQHFFLVHRMDKPRVLARILQSPDRGGVYVFTRTKNMADRLVQELEDLKISAVAVHGDLRQTTREKNLDRFRDGRADVLVATEVAARGLDVENVSHVVNYDCPEDEKMYLHRIGRTARAGAKGVAVTFAQFNEVDRLNVIRKAVEATDRDVEEVFSTSDRLQELFDLPDERPWDHLKKGGSSGSRGKDRRDKPTGRSDGRSKNSRSSEGKGAKSSSRRERPRDTQPAAREDASKRSPAAREDTSKRSSAPTRETPAAAPAAGDERSASTPTRTRTRTRARTGTGDEATTGSRAATSDDRPSGGRNGSGEADTRSGGSSRSSGRTRARARKRPDDTSTTEATTGTARDAETPASGEPKGGRSRNGRDRSSSSRSSSGSRSSGSGSSSSSSRSSSSRSSSEPRPEPTPGEEPTHRGEDARGEGTPQLARRVKVEHLP